MTEPLDPASVIAEFLDRVAPYDPSPGVAPVAMIAIRTAYGDQAFTASDHAVRALCKALDAYRDPDDRGECIGCGGRRLDENLHCTDCGQLHGILGQVIAQHVRRIQAAEGGAG